MKLLFFVAVILAVMALCFGDEVTPTVEKSRCDEDSSAGLRSICRASQRRVYFDKEKNECVNFIYGGCGASGNIFNTVEDCENLCKPKTS